MFDKVYIKKDTLGMSFFAKYSQLILANSLFDLPVDITKKQLPKEEIGMQDHLISMSNH